MGLPRVLRFGGGMDGVFWAVRRPGWVAGGLAVAVAGFTVWLLQSRSGVNVATVLVLPVSVASLGVAVWGLVPRPPLSRVARDLARQVDRERGAARRQALGMSGDARPADLRFRSPEARDEPELLRWRADGGRGRGTLREVADFYQSLDRGRMVILGEPGAGKTVLATQLVIDLIKALPDGELQPGARPPVPVWLSLTSADLGVAAELAHASSEELSSRLDQWIAVQISAVYQVPSPTAARLIREEWVLPVLDGLDEMDAPSTSAGDPERPRAAAVVRALNAGTGRRPVVLVCRRGEYGQLALSAGSTAEDPVLQDATQIVLQPLEVAAICGYLAARFPAGQPGRLASRWQGIAAALRASPSRDGNLAGILSSPWRLFLAATAYHDEDTDPGELTRIPPAEVAGYLLGQLIPAVTRHVPGPHGSRYSPGEVRVWLTTLAVYLDETSSDPRLQWSPTDLHLHRIWPIAGRKTVQWLTVITVTVLLGIAIATYAIVQDQRSGRWYPNSTTSWAWQCIGLIGLVFIGGRSVIDTDPRLERLSLNIRSAGQRRKLAFGLAGGLAVGLVSGLVGGLTYGLALGLAGGLAIALVAGLAVGLAGNFSLAAEPTTVMHQNLTFVVARGLGFGVAVGLTGGLTGVLAGGRTDGPILGLALGLAVGLEGGLGAWIRYAICCGLAWRNGMLPPRVGQFLDWAYRASLLRMSGTATQFRHRELQAWLSDSARNDLSGV